MGASEGKGQERKSFRVGLPLIIIGLLVVLVVLGVGGWLAMRAISSAICGSYNFISNDFCDKWHYDTPSADALPVPPRWDIRWEHLDCGSGGCGSRLYVLAPASGSEGGVAAYLREIQALGWRIDGLEAEARQGDLHLDVEPASNRARAVLVPKRLAREKFVFVALAICGEGAVCD